MTNNPADRVEQNVRDVISAAENLPEWDPERPETIPPNLFSGFVKRLDFTGQEKGFRYRWFNDEKGGTNINMALRSGWRFVKRTDGSLNAAVTPRNNDLGEKVRQHVDHDVDGSPMNAYLMRKPEGLCKLHDEGPGSREEYHQALERQIFDGSLGQKSGEKRYSAAHPYPGSPSTLPPISVGTHISRGK